MIQSIGETLISALSGFLISPKSVTSIFSDSINFLLKLFSVLDQNTINKIAELLTITNFTKVPNIELVAPLVKSNKRTLKHSKHIQCNSKIIAETSDLIWSNSSKDLETYAQNSFDFVLNDIKYRAAPDSSAFGTLYFGEGVCYGKLNLFAALCRRRGIETRFKLIPFKLTKGFENIFLMFLSEDELSFLTDIVKDAINIRIPHHFLEINLNGEWIDANPIQPAFLYKALGLETPSIIGSGRKVSKIKKDYVAPIYYTEIFPLFVDGASFLGRTKLGQILNKNIDSVSNIFST